MDNERAADTVGTRARRLIQNVAALLRTRWLQAQREGRAFARDIVTSAVLVVVAIVLVVMAVPLAVVTLILLLAQVVPAWAAVGLVLAAVLVAVGLLLFLARLKFRRRFQVVQDLRSDVAMIRKSVGRDT